MARPALRVDSGALIALANRRETANLSVNRVLADFFGELVTTWPAVTEVCHMIPDHLAPRLLAWLGSASWQIITLDRADFEIYRTKGGRRLEILPQEG